MDGVATVEPMVFSTDPATCEMYWKVRKGTFPSVGAVSYTHLRAHETVLDLVCRLLLETKKERTGDSRGQNTNKDKKQQRETRNEKTR